MSEWNGVPSITAMAHWLRYKKNGHIEILQWSDLCQKWFSFGVSGSDGPERIASEYDYLGPAFAPVFISTTIGQR